MKILLISTNQVSFAHRITPVGLLYLVSVLRHAGHDVRLLDLMFSKDPEKEIVDVLRIYNPDISGISLRNLDTMISKENKLISFQYKCFQLLKKHSDSISVLGGSGFTIAPRMLAELFVPDFGIAGEADHSFIELIRRIDKNLSFFDIPGLVYQKGEEWVVNDRNQNEALCDLPNQAIDLLDLNRYKRNRGFVGIISRRSCTQACSFCDERALYGDALRLRPAKSVVDELAYIRKKTGMKYFGFADPLFNSPRQHMLDILEEIIRRKLNIKFRVELNPVGQDAESVALLKRAGCIGVDYSPDAGSEAMLKNYNKGFTSEQIMSGAELYKQYQIPYSAGFLLGGPGENYHTVRETLSLAKKLPGFSLAYFTVGLTMGGNHSKMEKEVGHIAIDKESDMLRVKYYLDPAFDRQCAEYLLDNCQRNSNFYISDIFLSDIMANFWKLADFFNLRPVWRYGKIPSYIIRIRFPGRRILRWDDQQRRFVCM